jgi:hypothetical protein
VASAAGSSQSRSNPALTGGTQHRHPIRQPAGRAGGRVQGAALLRDGPACRYGLAGQAGVSKPPSPIVSGELPTSCGIRPEIGPPLAAEAGVVSVRLAPSSATPTQRRGVMPWTCGRSPGSAAVGFQGAGRPLHKNRCRSRAGSRTVVRSCRHPTGSGATAPLCVKRAARSARPTTAPARATTDRRLSLPDVARRGACRAASTVPAPSGDLPQVADGGCVTHRRHSDTPRAQAASLVRDGPSALSASRAGHRRARRRAGTPLLGSPPAPTPAVALQAAPMRHGTRRRPLARHVVGSCGAGEGEPLVQ